MDKNRAITLIESTFNFPFDEGRFRNFVINLLNDVNEQKGFEYIFGAYIRHSFKNHISKYRRLGTYTDPNGEKIDVLVVQLKNEWALERSRTMLRNFTADYLQNRDKKDAALVAYYTTNPDDWRFSYIRMEYKREKTESGKFKITQDITPAKRYSFLVGKNEPNHTAQSQLISILEDERNNPTLSSLENAFSVDAVTKQFYKDYRAQFDKLWNELNDIVAKDPKIATEFETKTIDTANFAKKLMGQIVFLYFLQKKGWLGVGKDENGNFKEWGTGPKNFLHRLFKKEFSEYNNFFNEVLEPLFYEALATERPNDIFSRFNCKIPFLNGGLFEPLNDYNWEETDIRIDNDLIGDVFKTFDQYNFTVREDEPLEKEVAVDPEMLGKVFENLLPENLRKGKGAYYTPRTIVHYMCQESLINYLDTECNSTILVENDESTRTIACATIPNADIETLIREGDIILELETAIVEEGKKYKSVLMDSIKDNAQALDDALANIKVCDPAIGSGAFPVGMLSEIVKARQVLEIYLCNKHSVYELKRHCIQNSLYGVDIDPGAIEIAKLRLWLSLVVDEDDYENIQPLPNLDYKIMQGNSLIEEFHGISLDIEKKSEQKDLFTGGSDLDTLIDDLHQKQNDFFNAEHPRAKKKKRNEVESAILNIFHNELGKDTGLAETEKKKIEADLKEMTHGNKERNFFPWKLYFADVFREKGGFDVVIANPPYISAIEMKKTLEAEIIFQYKQNFETARGTIDIFVLFFEKGFKILSLGGALSFITPNKYLSAPYGKALRNFFFANTQITQFVDLSQIPVFDEVSVYPILTFGIRNKTRNPFKTIKLINNDLRDLELGLVDTYDYEYQYLNEFPDSVWGFLLTGNYDLLKKIIDQSTSLMKVGKINATSTAGEADIFSDFISNEMSSGAYKLINTGTIDKFAATWGFKDMTNKGAKYLTPYLSKNKHISNYRSNMYDSPKLIFAKMAKEPEIFIDFGGEFSSINTNCIYDIIEDYDIFYLGGFCNSKIFQFIYRQFFGGNRMAGGYYQFQAPQIRLMSVFPADSKIQTRISKRVKQIIVAKKTNPQADTTALEAEIDQLVYALYGLTEEEIAIVEESVG